MGPSGNEQGGHFFLSLMTRKRLLRHQWTALPMPQDAIDQINEMGRLQNMPRRLAFANRYGECITNDGYRSDGLMSKYNEDSIDSDYQPSDSDNDQSDDSSNDTDDDDDDFNGNPLPAGHVPHDHGANEPNNGTSTPVKLPTAEIVKESMDNDDNGDGSINDPSAHGSKSDANGKSTSEVPSQNDTNDKLASEPCVDTPDVDTPDDNCSEHGDSSTELPMNDTTQQDVNEEMNQRYGLRTHTRELRPH